MGHHYLALIYGLLGQPGFAMSIIFWQPSRISFLRNVSIKTDMVSNSGVLVSGWVCHKGPLMMMMKMVYISVNFSKVIFVQSFYQLYFLNSDGLPSRWTDHEGHP